MSLNDEFKIHAKESQEAYLAQENRDIAGLKSGSVDGIIQRSATATFNSYNKIITDEAAKAKRSYEDQMFMALLNADARLAALDKDIAEGLEALYEIYGGPEGLAEVFLTPEEREGLTTPDEINAALVDKYLDENGQLKPEHADLDPRLVDVLQDIHARERILEEVNNPNRTPESLNASVAGTSLADKKYLNEHAQGNDVTEVVKEQEMSAAEGSGSFFNGSLDM